MLLAMLPLLRCPACAGVFVLTPPTDVYKQAVIDGTLVCQQCRRQFPIVRSIADLRHQPHVRSLAHGTNELPLTAWAYERFWRPQALTRLSGEPFPLERERALLLALADPQPGSTWIDLACSNGLYARALAQALGPHGGIVLGIDQSRPMLEDARQRARRECLPISYLCATAQHLPLEPGCADGLVIGGSLNEIGDLHACLAQVASVLRPSGRFVAMTLLRHPARRERLAQQLVQVGGIRFWDADTLCAHFAAHGLQVVERQQYGIVLFTAAQRLPDERT